jgi:SAM-dependent methyltransferase
VLAEFDAAALVRSNWSYREGALALLGASPGERYPVAECRSCGVVYAALLPDAHFLAVLHDKVIDAHAAREHKLSSANAAAKMDYLAPLLRMLPRDREARVLDYGCGIGPTLQAICAVPGLRAVGFETSVARLQDLRARGLPVLDSQEALTAAAPFDAIVLDNVLEHVPHPRSTLSFLRTLLAPGAAVFVSIPSIDADAIRQAARTGQGTGAVRMDVNPWGHLNYFDVPHLDLTMRDAGLRALEASALSSAVNVGLRPERRAVPRAKNALASMARLAGYAATGDAMASVAARFYVTASPVVSQS